jgi:hypothetical protein
MFENPMPEDPDAQAAELDFESQAAAAEQQAPPPQAPPPQPAYQPPAQQHAPEPEPQVDPAQFYAQLEEMFEEDPLQAAAILAEVTAAEQAQQIHQQYAPIVEDYYGRQATSAADALRAEYGEETIAQILPALEQVIEENLAIFENPATRDGAMRMAIDSLLYRGGPQPVDPDAQAIEAIGEFAPSAQAQDRFGAQGAGYHSGSAGRPPVGNVYVEGGSTPPPPPRPPMTVDEAIKAEIDVAAEGAGRDAFGRRGVPKR